MFRTEWTRKSINVRVYLVVYCAYCHNCCGQIAIVGLPSNETYFIQRFRFTNLHDRKIVAIDCGIFCFRMQNAWGLKCTRINPLFDSTVNVFSSFCCCSIFIYSCDFSKEVSTTWHTNTNFNVNTLGHTMRLNVDQNAHHTLFIPSILGATPLTDCTRDSTKWFFAVKVVFELRLAISTYKLCERTHLRWTWRIHRLHVKCILMLEQTNSNPTIFIIYIYWWFLRKLIDKKL